MAQALIRHRLAAILSADAAGYSRLMAADEESTIATLQAAREVFRKAIESRGGRVVDTAGDSVLAIFETANGAMSAALGVQETLNSSAAKTPLDRRLPFRIGLHLADVHELADGTVYGDGVNIAARLQALAEPGGIMLSDLVRSAIKGKIPVALQDAGEHHVKNIAEPVRVFRVGAMGEEAAPRPALSSLSRQGADLPLPEKPSIAVLPFTNMSADPEQGYFCDGISDDIITELSRFRSLFVIARNSSFTYRGRSIDVRTVARELGVRYVLEGGVRRAGKRIRLNAQLIDALTGAHLWAEKYERDFTDIFQIQEELTQRIVVSIAPFLDEAERNRLRRIPQHLGAYEISVRAIAKAIEAYWRFDATILDEALADAEAALQLDAASVNALGARAFCRWQQLLLGVISPSPDEIWSDGMEAANRAIAADRNDGRGYVQKALLLAFAPQQDPRNAALVNAREAYQFNPHDTGALTVLALVEALSGDTDSAIQHLNEVMRISPRDPMRYTVQNQFAMTWFLARRYAEGAEHAALGIAEAPKLGTLHGWLALCCVGLGDLPRARAALEAARKLAPKWVERGLEGRLVFRDPEHLGRLTSYMRIAAGLQST